MIRENTHLSEGRPASLSSAETSSGTNTLQAFTGLRPIRG